MSGAIQRGTPWNTRGTFNGIGLPGDAHVSVRPGEPIQQNDAFVITDAGEPTSGVQGVGDNGYGIGGYMVYVGEKLDAPDGWRYVPLAPDADDAGLPQYAVVAGPRG